MCALNLWCCIIIFLLCACSLRKFATAEYFVKSLFYFVVPLCAACKFLILRAAVIVFWFSAALCAFGAYVEVLVALVVCGIYFVVVTGESSVVRRCAAAGVLYILVCWCNWIFYLYCTGGALILYYPILNYASKVIVLYLCFYYKMVVVCLIIWVLTTCCCFCVSCVRSARTLIIYSGWGACYATVICGLLAAVNWFSFVCMFYCALALLCAQLRMHGRFAFSWARTLRAVYVSGILYYFLGTFCVNTSGCYVGFAYFQVYALLWIFFLLCTLLWTLQNLCVVHSSKLSSILYELPDAYVQRAVVAPLCICLMHLLAPCTPGAYWVALFILFFIIFYQLCVAARYSSTWTMLNCIYGLLFYFMLFTYGFICVNGTAWVVLVLIIFWQALCMIFYFLCCAMNSVPVQATNEDCAVWFLLWFAVVHVLLAVFAYVCTISSHFLIFGTIFKLDWIIWLVVCSATTGILFFFWLSAREVLRYIDECANEKYRYITYLCNGGIFDILSQGLILIVGLWLLWHSLLTILTYTSYILYWEFSYDNLPKNFCTIIYFILLLLLLILAGVSTHVCPNISFIEFFLWYLLLLNGFLSFLVTLGATDKQKYTAVFEYFGLAKHPRPRVMPQIPVITQGFFVRYGGYFITAAIVIFGIVFVTI